MEEGRGDYRAMRIGKVGYTIKDIQDLPEGQRAELFEGELVMMSSPTATHQGVVGWLYFEIESHIRRMQGKCRVFLSPFGVLLQNDDKNYVEPDIVVVCDAGKLDNEGCHGAPDWVIEVVSPSSRKLDYDRKSLCYFSAGVREYWIVDPEKEIIVVYRKGQWDIPMVCRFGDSLQAQVCEGLVMETAPLKEICY